MIGGYLVMANKKKKSTLQGTGGHQSKSPADSSRTKKTKVKGKKTK